MQPVTGGANPLAGASATLPCTSPYQANPTASKQYATLRLHVIIPKTEASQSRTTVKMENAQSSIPAFTSALDDSVTQSVQSSASTVVCAALHLQSTFKNQGSYPTAIPVTVHYAVQVPNYGIPALPQTAPPPPPASVSFPSQPHTGHFPSSVPTLPKTAPPPSASFSFPIQSHKHISPPPPPLYLGQPHLLPISVFILFQVISHTQAISFFLFLYPIILLIQPKLTQQMKVIH